MKALQIDRHGPHADLRPRDIPARPLQPGEVRVEVHAAGVNPSDVSSAEGRFAYASLPRILGRDFSGRVVEGPAEWLGAEVWGTGGDLGITRDGTHAEQIILPVAGVSRRPANLSVEEAAAVGVPFTTAWSALMDTGHLKAGEWVIVSGAAGAVGSAALELAAAQGAQVIALVKDDAEGQRVDRTRVAAVATSERGNLVEVVRTATGGRGADLALNGVGGVIFQPLLEALADGGRMVNYSVAGGREVLLDLFNLYRRRLILTGVNTGLIDATAGARILTVLTPLFASGQLAQRQALELCPLSQAASAYARVAGGSPAKQVLVPDAPRSF
jgi:NADPH:quinone reductase-like Zn-dependent oxidoreductase